MEKYALEVLNWGDWELEKDFSSLDRAKRYGAEHFPQNEWRIFDRIAGSIAHHHDPVSVLEETARSEVHRFSENERWRRVYAERAAASVVAQQQREHLTEVASRQRQIQSEQNERRRRRLHGFNFVGTHPAVLDDPDIADIAARTAGARFPHWQWGVEYEELSRDYTSLRADFFEKTNWLKEGF